MKTKTSATKNARGTHSQGFALRHCLRRHSAPWLAVCVLSACASDAGSDENNEAALTASFPSTTASDSAASGSTSSPSPVSTPAATPSSTSTGSPSNTNSAPVNVPVPPVMPPVSFPSGPTPSPEPSAEGGGPSDPGFGGAGGADTSGSGGTPIVGFGGTAGAGAGGETVGGVGGSDNGGGAGAESSSAGAGSSPNTEDTPCPTNGEPCKILPLGDSITDGIGSPGGYRVELFQHALDEGYNITFVGGSMNGPNSVGGEPFPQSHEGHSGWTIQQIDDIVPDPALDDDPHIILLHIGTNDMYQMPGGAPERLAELIDQLLENNPDTLLVVSTIIPFPGAGGAVDTFNDGVVDVVEERINQGARLLLVDQFTGFPESELGDGVHPNAAGYARMAGVWFDAIGGYLR